MNRVPQAFAQGFTNRNTLCHLTVYRHRPRSSFAGGDELTNNARRRHAAVQEVRLQVVDPGVQKQALVVVFLIQPHLCIVRGKFRQISRVNPLGVSPLFCFRRQGVIRERDALVDDGGAFLFSAWTNVPTGCVSCEDDGSFVRKNSSSCVGGHTLRAARGGVSLKQETYRVYIM